MLMRMRCPTPTGIAAHAAAAATLGVALAAAPLAAHLLHCQLCTLHKACLPAAASFLPSVPEEKGSLTGPAAQQAKNG